MTVHAVLVTRKRPLCLEIKFTVYITQTIVLSSRNRNRYPENLAQLIIVTYKVVLKFTDHCLSVMDSHILDTDLEKRSRQHHITLHAVASFGFSRTLDRGSLECYCSRCSL